MAKVIDPEVIKEITEKNEMFFDNISTEMNYKSNMSGDAFNFEDLEYIASCCSNIDDVVRKPKLILINRSDTEIIEKAKKITSESIRDLSCHAQNIDDYNPGNGDIRLNKILNIYSEETYNIYENRFLYTLIYFIQRFVMKKEKELEELELERYRKLAFTGETKLDHEVVEVNVLIKGVDKSNPENNKKLKEALDQARKNIRTIKDYLTDWAKSDLMKSLEREKVRLINPPIKKTNIILKNPNFQIAVKLWDFLYDYKDKDQVNNEALNSSGNNLLSGLLEHSFLVDYYVLDSVCKTKAEQKEKLSEYAFFLINEEIKRLIDLLRQCGFKITDEEILDLIARNLETINHAEVDKAAIVNQDIKKKFQNAMDDYLERVHDYL